MEALMGGAAVVVAGLIVWVAVLVCVVVVCWVDDVGSAEEEGVDGDCVVDEDWVVDEEAEAEAEAEVEAEVDVDVEIVRVVNAVEVETAAVGFVDEDEEAAEEGAEVDVAEDNTIKLPPLDNTVTVFDPPTTTVDAVTVVGGPLPLLLPTPELVTLVTLSTLVLVLVVKSKLYVVLGNKLCGNVANADESTETALVVWGVPEAELAGHPAILSAQEVIVVKSVVAAVVWMGITIASVDEGGICIVAVLGKNSQP